MLYIVYTHIYIYNNNANIDPRIYIYMNTTEKCKKVGLGGTI